MAAAMRNMRVCFLCRKSLHLSKKRIFDTIFLRVQMNGVAPRNFEEHASELVVNHKWRLDPRVDELFHNKATVKHRQHPGIVQNAKKVQLPPKLQDAISLMIEKYPTKDLEKRSQQLAQYIWSRHRPAEDVEIKFRAQQLDARIRANYDVGEHTTEEDIEKTDNEVKQKVIRTLRKDLYHWKPIRYDAYKSFLYLVGRISQDYSTLYQIFSEIGKRDQDFHPESMFDFGSGVGSSIWAANEMWGNFLKERYCVDESPDMNTIARLLLQGGEEESEMDIPGVYFRQFMPASEQTKYDLVVSAFSLLELPSQSERLNTLYSLWKKTDKYLVIVENGTNEGFQSILEAREFILQFSKNEMHSEEEREELTGHVFAPCPHDKGCGRYARQDGTPCNFAVQYKPLQLSSPGEGKQQLKYSYIVLKKGQREEGETWPRVVREVSRPSKRVHLRTCCPNGDLQMSVITASKHGRNCYWCARACKWGDLFPAVPSSVLTSEDLADDSSVMPTAVADLEIEIESDQDALTPAHGEPNFVP